MPWPSTAVLLVLEEFAMSDDGGGADADGIVSAAAAAAASDSLAMVLPLVECLLKPETVLAARQGGLLSLKVDSALVLDFERVVTQ